MRWLVTGGCGFIGANLVRSLMASGQVVEIIDDLSRSGVEANRILLEETYGLKNVPLDVSVKQELEFFLADRPPFDVIVHLAGQVSFMESLRDPLRDFQVNVVGTLNILEHLRLRARETALVALSSNKVYGSLETVRFEEDSSRYIAPDWPHGFDESLPLKFAGPYGCSKGALDQYVFDYGQMFGLRTASLRQSSVYGPLQHPMADQGWVAYLIQESLASRRIQLHGNGKQVRDLLFVDDLCELLQVLPGALVAGQPVQANVGGGQVNSLSLLELFDWLQSERDCLCNFSFGTQRPKDQPVFVSSNERITSVTGWRPVTPVGVGLAKLADYFVQG